MEIGAYLVADALPFEPVKPGEGALDVPASPAQAGAVSSALARCLRCDAPGS